MKTNINNTTQTNSTTKKIINWSEYNKSLENRGNFTVLLNIAYLNSIPEHTGKAGHPKEYTDAVILFLAELREFTHLPIRQTIGTAKFILKLAGLDLKLPSRSTISRRLGLLKIPTGLENTNWTSPIIFLPDSTGLKISGEGEWKVKKHGAEGRRKWIKLHLGIDYATKMIVSSATSSPDAHDGKYLKRLFRKAKQNCGHGKGKKVIEQTIADGSYDGREYYEYIEGSGSNLLVPPPKNATEHYDVEGNARTGRIIDSPGYKTRNSYLKSIKELGRDGWKNQSGYHKRSISETGMYRFKQTFGGGLKSKLKKNQIAEINIRIFLLNLFTSYGLPRYAT
jgi:hypothetical protein